MPYVDGFLLPVPKKNLAKYRQISKKAGKVWREHGALEYRECVGDDLKPQPGMATAFSKSAKARAGETVVFSWIVYKSKAHRNQVLRKVLADPRLHQDMKDMPFDPKRMAYGGFKVIVDV
jgi:uncharacterized protein YbaA (DUF1428 family)